MEWQPAPGSQLLAPFDHQVAGQSSMLRYDATTVCKPLIAREHFVYKTLPEELQEFTPEYRGEVEVQLQEEDGYIQLYGKSVGIDASTAVCLCSSDNDHDDSEQLDVRPKVTTKPQEESSMENRCMIRVLRSGSYEVCPGSDEVFYTKDSTPHHPHTQSLNPWSLKNHKRLLDKMRKSEHSHDKIRFILLKNVVADFRHPCILDLKIGSRLHGDDASHVKVASQSTKCRETTSSTLGVRLCGMQVYQVDSGAYHSVDKYHGRTLNNQSFKDMLYDFLHNGTRFRTELIQPIVSRLSGLIKCLQGLSSFRFYASSLLIIYDGGVSDALEDWEDELHSTESSHTTESTPSESMKDSFHSSQNLHINAFKTPDSPLGCDIIKPGNASTSVRSSSLSPSERCLHGSLACQLCCKGKHVEIHTHQSLYDKDVKTDDHLGNVPAMLNDVLHVTNLSAPHSSQHVPRGTLSTVDAVNSNQHIISAVDQHSNTGKEIVLDNKNHLLGSKWDQTTDDSLWLRSHFITSEPSHSNALDNQGQKIISESMDSNELSHKDVKQNLSNRIPDNLQNLENVANFSHISRSPQVSGLSSKSQEQFHNLSSHLEKQGESLIQNHKQTAGGPSGSEYQAKSVKLTGLSCGANTSLHSGYPENHRLPLEQTADPLPKGDHSGRDSEKVDVRMIDFAHTTHNGFTSDKVKHTGPDWDYIQGLQNLMDLFQQLHDDS